MANVFFGSWVCENVGQARELPLRLNYEIFGANEINSLEGQELRASSGFAQEIGKIGVSTQSRSKARIRSGSEPGRSSADRLTYTPESRQCGGRQP
jgi:hypothetical protein